MIKVTKQGVDPATIEHKGACKTCRTEFTFLLKDLHWPRAEDSLRFAPDTPVPWIVCPTCATNVCFPEHR